MRDEDLGHEPTTTHDKDFAPVNRGADARGRTVTPDPVTPAEEGMNRQEDETSGTGVPGVDVGRPDALPPDALPADEEGVRKAEETDDT